MSKNIKFSVSTIIIMFLLVLGLNVYAQDGSSIEIELENKIETSSDEPIACTMDAKVCPDGSSVGRVGPNCEFAKCPGEIKPIVRPLFKAELKEKTKEIRNDIEKEKDNIKNLREEHRIEIENMIQSTKDKREEFKKDTAIKREEIKTRAEEIRAKFKEGLIKIKDEKKKISAEKIVVTVQELNTKATTHLSERVEKIENVLVSIESRIRKGEERGLDVSSAITEAEKAKATIASAREAISVQSIKLYEINITDEANLRAEMKRLRDLFTKDIKAVNELVKKAHIAVKTTATTLAKIPKINDEPILDTTVDTNTTN